MQRKRDAVSSPIGQRIHIIGNSNSGKSTLGKQLAKLLGIALIELDAINWLPNWVGLNTTDPDEFEKRITEATIGEAWVVEGSYIQFSQNAFWSHLETVIWLDLPLRQLIWRLLIRSWRRWRTKELLWDTNHESFWGQFMIWKKKESLLWWLVTQHQKKRREMLTYMLDPRWEHIRFIRLTTSSEVEAFIQDLHILSRQKQRLNSSATW